MKEVFDLMNKKDEERRKRIIDKNLQNLSIVTKLEMSQDNSQQKDQNNIYDVIKKYKDLNHDEKYLPLKLKQDYQSSQLFKNKISNLNFHAQNMTYSYL